MENEGLVNNESAVQGSDTTMLYSRPSAGNQKNSSFKFPLLKNVTNGNSPKLG